MPAHIASLMCLQGDAFCSHGAQALGAAFYRRLALLAGCFLVGMRVTVCAALFMMASTGHWLMAEQEESDRNVAVASSDNFSTSRSTPGFCDNGKVLLGLCARGLTAPMEARGMS